MFKNSSFQDLPKKEIKNHIHCKECGGIITLPYHHFDVRVLYTEGRLELASETLSICKNCIVTRGIVYYKKKKKGKK